VQRWSKFDQKWCSRLALSLAFLCVSACGGSTFPSSTAHSSAEPPSSVSEASRVRLPAPTTTTVPRNSTDTVATFPLANDVQTGVNSAFSSPFIPLYEIRGMGSRTSAPLTFLTTNIGGGVENDGWVKVYISPVPFRPGDRALMIYANGAGDGGAGAKLPRPGTYVVTVEALNPGVKWLVDFDDQSSNNP
jgi:hypothetical protein